MHLVAMVLMLGGVIAAFSGCKPGIRPILGYTSSPESRSHILVPMPTAHQVSLSHGGIHSWALAESQWGGHHRHPILQMGTLQIKERRGTATWQVAAGLELELRAQILGKCPQPQFRMEQCPERL